MANHSKKIESKQQEWDMEFMDPFSLEDDELAVYCSGSLSKPPVTATTTTFCSDGRLAAETSNVLVQRVNAIVSSSLQTINNENKPATAGLEVPSCKDNFKEYELETEAAESMDESRRTQHMNEPVMPCTKRSFCDSNVELSCSEAEEQLPIPVMLSSAKRFCASKESRSSKEDNTYFRLPSPSAILTNSPCFAQPAYSLSAYNIPVWPAANLPPSDSRTGVQIPSVIPYSNNVPYTVVLSHPTTIPVLHNQSPVSVIDSGGTALWSESQLQLQNILSKPPPAVPGVSHAAVLGLPASNFPVHSPPVRVLHLQNGLTSHRLPLANLPQVVSPFTPPNVSISASSHSVLLPDQQRQSRNTISALSKSDLPVVSNVSLSDSQIVPHCDTQQPEPSSANSNGSILSSPSHNTECSKKHLMPNDKALLSLRQLRCVQPVTGVFSTTVACTGLPVSNLCPTLTSSGFAGKQTLPVSCSNIPLVQVKCSSAFTHLDPRLHNGHRQSASATSQIPSSTNASSHSSTFIVPVPPPLPTLEELTAECRADLQKDDKTVMTGLTFQSATSGAATTDSSMLDRVGS